VGRNYVIAYYFSNKFASEYKVGYDLSKIALEADYSYIITSDLELNNFNISGDKSRLIKIPTIIKHQKYLYKFGDFLPQFIWHLKVQSFLRKSNESIGKVWLVNGAAPWFPIRGYISTSNQFIWGPVGGGDYIKFNEAIKNGFLFFIRECLRKLVCITSILIKVNALRNDNVRIIARTKGAKKYLQKYIKTKEIVVIPEIINPIKQKLIKKQVNDLPVNFIWVGQDIPRKNLSLALSFFGLMRAEFPDSIMHIYGVSRDNTDKNILYHGWVNEVPWINYQNAVYILSSYREGLPSSLLEAVNNGLLCFSTNVGSIELIKNDQIILFDRFFKNNLYKYAEQIRNYLKKPEIRIMKIDFSASLKKYI
jgi:glycosyltransferase involved in cell wall biosynthesis